MTQSVQHKTDLDITQIKNTIIETYKGDVKSKFIIGEQLDKAKSITKYDGKSKEAKKGVTSYDSLINDLPFGKSTGEKFIRISKTTWLKDLAYNDETSGNLPTGYNSLYSFTKDDYQSKEMRTKLIDVLTKGTIKDKSTCEMSASSIINSLSEKSEVTEDKSFTLLSVKVSQAVVKSDGTFDDMISKSTNFTKVKDLIEKLKTEIKDSLCSVEVKDKTLESIDKSSQYVSKKELGRLADERVKEQLKQVA